MLGIHRSAATPPQNPHGKPSKYLFSVSWKSKNLQNIMKLRKFRRIFTSFARWTALAKAGLLVSAPDGAGKSLILHPWTLEISKNTQNKIRRSTPEWAFTKSLLKNLSFLNGSSSFYSSGEIASADPKIYFFVKTTTKQFLQGDDAVAELCQVIL